MTLNEAIAYVKSRNPPPGFLEVMPLEIGRILVAEIRRLTEQRARLYSGVDEWAIEDGCLPVAVEEVMEEIDSEES